MTDKQVRRDDLEGLDQQELENEHAIDLPERTALSIVQPSATGMPVAVGTIGMVDTSASPPPPITVEDAPPPDPVRTLPPA